MAEEPRPDPSAPDKNGTVSPDAPEHADTNWGADWESAFQAEDDTFFAPADEEFFLEEEPAKETKKPAADAALEKALAEAQPAGAATPRKPLLPTISLAPLLGLFGKITVLPGLLLPLPRALWQRFAALSVRLQLTVIGGSLFVLLTGGIAVWFFVAQGPEVAPTAATTPPPLTEEAKAILAEIPSVPEKLRKKLALNDFLIPIRDDKGGGPLVLVQVDLTLNTLLGGEEELPPDKEAMARDVIYQFFANRTLAELRRYQIARGDLQRDLRAWLEKQWPDTPVESITFTRYQLG